MVFEILTNVVAERFENNEFCYSWIFVKTYGLKRIMKNINGH